MFIWPYPREKDEHKKKQENIKHHLWTDARGATIYSRPSLSYSFLAN